MSETFEVFGIRFDVSPDRSSLGGRFADAEFQFVLADPSDGTGWRWTVKALDLERGVLVGYARNLERAIADAVIGRIAFGCPRDFTPAERIVIARALPSRSAFHSDPRYSDRADVPVGYVRPMGAR